LNAHGYFQLKWGFDSSRLDFDQRLNSSFKKIEFSLVEFFLHLSLCSLLTKPSCSLDVTKLASGKQNLGIVWVSAGT